jgi:hypothetical protein
MPKGHGPELAKKKAIDDAMNWLRNPTGRRGRSDSQGLANLAGLPPGSLSPERPKWLSSELAPQQR